MTTRVFWGENDHRVRATALATAYAATAGAISDNVAQVPGLTKMVLWGHGTAGEFCRMRPEALVAKIRSWQVVNPTLETVEMITCNIRHAETGRHSYTDKVVTELSRKPNKALKQIKFRALPICTTPDGQTCGYSILKWHPASSTWAYVAAPVKDVLNHWDNHMHDGVVKLEDFMAPRGAATNYPAAFAAYKKSEGKHLGDPYATRRNWNTQDYNDYNLKFKAVKASTFVAAGTLGTLRWFLVDLK